MTGKERMLRRDSRLRALLPEHASSGGGYIFGTSNTIFHGMRWLIMDLCWTSTGSLSLSPADTINNPAAKKEHPCPLQ